MRKAEYHYRTYGFNGEYTDYKTLVEILEESDKSYKIKLLQCGPNKQLPGTITWVRKRNIKTVNN